MAKKKFNLGDIIRKLNEDQASTENERVEKNSNNVRTPAQTQNTDRPSPVNLTTPSFQAPVDPKPEPQPEEDMLPNQPVLGTRTPPGRPRKSHSHAQLSLEENATSINTQISPAAAIGVAEGPQEHASEQTGAAAKKISNPISLLNKKDDEEEESFDIYRYIGIILRRKNVVILVMSLTFLYALFSYLTAPRYFISHARLLFRPEDQVIIGESSPYTLFRNRENLLNTHLELLRSQSVLAMVAENMGNKVSAAQIGATLTIAQGATNGQKNDIIELTYKHPGAEIARDVLNDLCRTYIDYRRDVNAQEDTRFIYKLEEQINKLQVELDRKENDLRSFKEQNRMVQLSTETNLTVQKLADMELELQKTQLSMVESKERLTALNSQIGKQEMEVVQSITYNDPFQAKLADLELELNTLTAENSAEHPKVRMIKQQIDNIKEAASQNITREAASKTMVKNPIRQELLQNLVDLNIEASALETKRTAQEKIIERLDQDLLKLPSLELKYAYLQRETESLLQTMAMLKSKYEESKIKRDSQESELKILELAQTPNTAISKVKLSNIFIGLFVGLILGIALAFLLEYLDQSIKEPAVIEKELELPLLGIVPLIEADKALVEGSTTLPKNILEPFRALRANLKHIMSAHEIKTLMVASAVKGEGKTTLAANLAITFAMDGKKVILIDGDLRRSQMHHLFNIRKENGIADFLLASKELDEIIKPTKYDNLFVITSGDRPSNPAELLGTYRFEVLLQELRPRADVIIFDSPALLPVSDSITMAPKMDGCVMVVRNLWTPLKAARQARMQLTRINSNLFGGILNGVSQSRGYYPYYYGYYGYYSYKYSYEEEARKPFSLRQFGLNTEKKLKDSLKNIRYAAPRYVAAAGSAGHSMLRKKRFWVLFLLLMSLTGLNVWLQSRPKPQIDDTIRYIGINAMNGSAVAAAPEHIPGFPSGKTPAATPSVTGTAPVTFDTSSLVNDSIQTFTGYKDSLQKWVRSLATGDLTGYLTLYDSLLFRYDRGRYVNWKEEASRLLIPSTNGPRPMTIDSAWVDRCRPTTCEVHAIVRNKEARPEKTEHIFLWVNGFNGWRIVRERVEEEH